MRTSLALGALGCLLLLCACGTSTSDDAGLDAAASDAAVDAALRDGPATDAPGNDAGGDAGGGGDAGSDSGCTDADGDGHGAIACGGDDCNDADANTYPGNTERCDSAGHDEDCNPATLGPDADGDTYAGVTCCNVQPGGGTLCGTDCDDTRATVNPTAVESCNGTDDNCNGMVDEGVLLSWYPDADGDGYGAAGATATHACTMPAGQSATSDDCNDANMAVHPGAAEICDGIDNNCDASIDPGCPCMLGASRSCGLMTSGGGFFTTPPCHPGTQTCVMDTTMMTSTWTACTGNHDPVAETCNGIDDNCDGTVDEGLLLTFYRDADADGFGTMTMPTMACSAPAGYVATSGDCDDMRLASHPGAPEICNGIDDNCNSVIDDGVLLTFYRDADGDGFGTSAMTMLACSAPTGYVATGGDCDDTRIGVYPTATEVCNGIDDNCNSMIDEGVLLTFYRDADSDGFGVAGMTTMACTPPAGYVALAGDCNDGNLAVHPGLPELCNGIDDNCAGGVDEMPASVDNSCIPMMGGTTYACTAGACQITACPPGRGDCDGGFANGCEVDTTVTTANCGTCGHACPFACAASVCDPVVGLTGGGDHTCAVRMSGLAACWGRGAEGQLGDGLSSSHPRPTAIPSSSFADATGIAGGSKHSCVVRSSGGAMCWGTNTDGQLGTGDPPATVWTVPRATNPLGGTGTKIASSQDGNVSCAIVSTGQASCWGRNVSFQVGDGTFFAACPQRRVLDAGPTPVMVDASTLLSNALAIAPGAYHSCAIRGAALPGQVVCWGSNATGELGDGATSHLRGAVQVACVEPVGFLTAPRYTTSTGGSCPPADPVGFVRYDCSIDAVNVTGLANAIAIASGDFHSCAIRSGGQVVCWGDNEFAQAGVGSTTTPYYGTMQNVVGVADAVAIATSSTSTCAIRAGGQVVCWGDNGQGQLGRGTTGGNSPTAMNVTGLADATRIAGGSRHFCAVRAGGAVVCWGVGAYGQLGDGLSADHNAPATVLPLP